MTQDSTIRVNLFLSHLRPFLWVSFSWLLFGLLFCLIPGRVEYLGWMIGLWFISLCDLFALAKTAQAAVNLASDSTSSGRGFSNLLLWGFLKFLCLGVFIGILLFAKGVAGSILVLGIGTVVIVPLFGGFFWFRTEPAGT